MNPNPVANTHASNKIIRLATLFLAWTHLCFAYISRDETLTRGSRAALTTCRHRGIIMRERAHSVTVMYCACDVDIDGMGFRNVRPYGETYVIYSTVGFLVLASQRAHSHVKKRRPEQAASFALNSMPAWPVPITQTQAAIVSWKLLDQAHRSEG